ncbi:MAG: FGGY-family carbohydrate kinase [Clostridiales bacterium]|jgi:xylulokinase|nr:FGGY-family carbohydrate kinase [Clostridiales bacterium]
MQEQDKSNIYIIAHDMGTSSDKAVLIDFNGRIAASSKQDYPTYYPYPAWVEQIPSDYWNAVCAASKKLIGDNAVDPAAVKGVIFSTQSMGLIPVDDKGNTLYNNITWVDGRAEKQAQSLMKKLGGKKLFSLVAGTPIMGKDVVAKIQWIKEERPDVYNHTKYFLDVNGYLKFKCTGKCVAELSGASSYGLDLKKKTWLPALKLIGIDLNRLPPLVKSTDVVGGLLPDAAKAMGLLADTPVFGGSDDVQSAAIGSGMSSDGDVHIYLGTSAWVCASSEDKTKFKNGAAAIQSADPNMNLIVGITEAAGSNIQWLCDQFFKREQDEQGENIYRYMDDIIETVPPGSDYLVCTPWMLGERCPVSSTTTRATLYNINTEHTRNHLMRAVYEGIAYNLRWILENFYNDYGFKSENFRIIGGGALDKAWMQIIADVTGKEFSVIENPRNAGALGAAITALIGLGEVKSFKDARDFVAVVEQYRPNRKNKEIYDELFASYKDIYYGLKKAYQKVNSKRFGN